ncbi:mcm22p [Saccharomyces arboricola H-6]|uniref:Mcm22p n=1 Tax=Saccharomyces arboricola (strain H-6 / AS 2.3317 / CBS 10644) TaxID=1160507 RepID=J8LM16_SACAR|nr:mcm22p [Saccharomyces arboricola H-6]
MDTGKDVLDVYIKNLGNQIENKRYFLKQARSAIDEITKRPIDTEVKPADPEIFAELLRKPMFLSERADPIGFCLTSNFLSSRAQSTSKWLSLMNPQSIDSKEMVSLQKKINGDLEELVQKLQYQLTILDDNKQDLTHVKTSKSRNEELWASLIGFVKDFLVPNLDKNEHSTDSLTNEIALLLKRLIEHDLTLTLNSCSPQTMPIYRLLLRANVLTVSKSPTNPDIKYIKLVDFNESCLT